MNETVPATRKTARYCVPGATVRPVRYAVNTPMTRQYANQVPRYFPMLTGPGGNTVIDPTGPCFCFSNVSGDFISLCVQCGNIYTPRLRPAARIAAKTLSSSGSCL